MKNLDFEWLTDEFMLYCCSTQLHEKTMSSYEQTLHLTGNGLPANNYPMKIREGEVYVIRYTLSDGSIRMEYMRTDGNAWDGMMLSEEFRP